MGLFGSGRVLVSVGVLGRVQCLEPVKLTPGQDVVDGVLTRVDRESVSERRRLGASAALLLDAVAYTEVGGTIDWAWEFEGPHTISAGEDIVGPFEAGFGTTQDGVIRESFGCSTPSLCYSDGGTDTKIAQAACNHNCNVNLPWCETSAGSTVDCDGADFTGGDVRYSFLDTCGGHTREYHLHQWLTCLYDSTAPGHSTKLGAGRDSNGTPLSGSEKGDVF